MIARAGDWHFTSSGGKFNALDPRPEEIYLEDLAHGCACENRWVGQVPAGPYSVAQHSVLVSVRASELAHIEADKLGLEFGEGSDFFALAARWGLLHDAAEGLGLGDMISPVKRFMPEYRTAEQRLLDAVADRFKLPREMPDVVVQADADVFVTEARDLFPNHPGKPSWTGTPLEQRIEPWLWQVAKARFFARFAELWPKGMP